MVFSKQWKKKRRTFKAVKTWGTGTVVWVVGLCMCLSLVRSVPIRAFGLYILLSVLAVLTCTVTSCVSFFLLLCLCLLSASLWSEMNVQMQLCPSTTAPNSTWIPRSGKCLLSERSLWKTFDHTLTQTCVPHRHPPAVAGSGWVAGGPGLCVSLA